MATCLDSILRDINERLVELAFAFKFEPGGICSEAELRLMLKIFISMQQMSVQRTCLILRLDFHP